MQENEYPAAPEGSVRLNKFLASCGYESRRAADRLIAEGRVEVNGKVVDTPGLRVMPSDFVKVDGRHATPKEEVVLLLNKPRGFVCSRESQGAIGTVYDLLPAKYRYVNYVGRLDADSEGLLLFTNSGTLSQKISHPSGGIEKEYWVTLDQAFDNSVLIQLLKGVRIPEGQAKAKYISRLSARRACVVLEQGLKRQVRQMFACLGLRVRKLVRVRIGSLWGGDLEPGRTELLTPEQIELATTNPRRRKGLIGVNQAFKPRPAPDTGKPAATEDDDSDYIFNPADFETEEEALGSATKFDDSEGFEPERTEGRRPFGRAHVTTTAVSALTGIVPLGRDTTSVSDAKVLSAANGATAQSSTGEASAERTTALAGNAGETSAGNAAASVSSVKAASTNAAASADGAKATSQDAGTVTSAGNAAASARAERAQAQLVLHRVSGVNEKASASVPALEPTRTSVAAATAAPTAAASEVFSTHTSKP